MEEGRWVERMNRINVVLSPDALLVRLHVASREREASQPSRVWKSKDEERHPHKLLALTLMPSLLRPQGSPLWTRPASPGL